MISQVFLFGVFKVQLKDLSIEITQDDGCKLCLILEDRYELAEFITALSSAIRPSTQVVKELPDFLSEIENDNRAGSA